MCAFFYVSINKFLILYIIYIYVGIYGQGYIVFIHKGVAAQVKRKILISVNLQVLYFARNMRVIFNIALPGV